MASEARIGIRTDTKQAEAGVKSVQGLFRGLQAEAKKSILTGVGLGAGVAAFQVLSQAVAGAVDFMGDAVQSAREDETSVALLTQSLKENTAERGRNLDKIEEVIAKRMELGFADEEQRESLRALVAVTKDSSAALDLQRTAMDLARLKGLDLETATTLLGKVYGGNLGILARYGIQLKEGATATEAIAEIQRRAAGQAEAWANTSEGAAATLNIAFDELKEDIGRQLLPIFVDLAKFARDVLIPAIRDIGGAIGGVVGFIGDIGQAWATVGMDFGEMGDRIHDIADDTDRTFDQVKDQIKANMLEAGMSFEDAADSAERSFKRMGTDGATALREGGGQVVGAAEDMADATADEFGEMPGKMADAMLAEQKKLTDAVQQLLDFTKEALSPAQVIARNIGFLTSEELANGLRDGNPLVRDKSIELRNLALTELGNTTGVAQSGSAIGLAWLGGITGAIRNGVYDMTIAVSTIRNQLGHSLPTAGPLKGDAAERGGLAIGKAWAGGIAKGIGGAAGSLNLAALVPGAGAGGGLAAVGAGGVTVNATFSSVLPMTAAQLESAAMTLGPAIERYLRRL